MVVSRELADGGQGRMQDLILWKANVYAKLKICILGRKCNINFNFGVMNLYNLKIFATNTTIYKTRVFKNLEIAVTSNRSSLDPSLKVLRGNSFERWVLFDSGWQWWISLCAHTDGFD